MTQLDRVRSSFSRAHDNLFDDRYSAEFFNYSAGSYDPDTGEMTGQTRSSFGSEIVEIVPPAQDSTVDLQGTDFSWSTSIRLPESTSLVSDFVPLGENSERPTEVQVTDNVLSETTIYELHSYTEERGSGMVMCRLVEQ